MYSHRSMWIVAIVALASGVAVERALPVDCNNTCGKTWCYKSSGGSVWEIVPDNPGEEPYSMARRLVETDLVCSTNTISVTVKQREACTEICAPLYTSGQSGLCEDDSCSGAVLAELTNRLACAGCELEDPSQ
jgi:hypothetical protein